MHQVSTVEHTPKIIDYSIKNKAQNGAKPLLGNFPHSQSSHTNIVSEVFKNSNEKNIKNNSQLDLSKLALTNQ